MFEPSHSISVWRCTMVVTDKLKKMVEELRHDLNEVKEQVKQLLPKIMGEQCDFPVRKRAGDHHAVSSRLLRYDHPRNQ